jgi:AraC-like DNA-binding protein
MYLDLILDLLGQDKNAIQLLNYDYYKSITADKNEIINNVYEYLVNNFKNEVTLKEIADHVNYNPSTLCSFFKKHTQFTIFDCLRDIRISFACKLLNNSAQNITQIAYESGYNNLSHFNRQFIQHTSLTPSEYRSIYKSNI